MDNRPLPRRTLPPLLSSTNDNQLSRSTREEAHRELPKSVSQTKSLSRSTLEEIHRELPKPLSRSAPNKSASRTSNEMELRNKNSSLLHNGDGEDGTLKTSDLSMTRRARAKRRQSRETRSKTSRNLEIVENGHALTEMLSEEDIVSVERIENEGGISALPGVTGGVGSSQPQDKVYVQTTTGFTSRPTDWVASRQVGVTNRELSNLNDFNLATKTSDVALSFHKAFIFLSFLLHGFLGGISIWQIVFPFTLNASGDSNFISQYTGLALPFQTTFFILLIICFLSALDRYDFAMPGQNFFWRLLKFQTSAWLTLVYFIAFVISIGMAGIDFWLGNIAPFVSEPIVTDAYLNADVTGAVRTWLALNVIRSSFAILGWVIVSVRPMEDNTAQNLFASNEDLK